MLSLRVVWPATEMVISPINSCSKMFYVQESKGLGSTGNKSTYRFAIPPSFPNPWWKHPSLWVAAKKTCRVSLGTELQPQHWAHSWEHEDSSSSLACLLDPRGGKRVFWGWWWLIVVKCWAISTKIPWKFTKLTWWNHQNEESKTSNCPFQFTQSLGDNRFIGWFFPWLNGRGSVFHCWAGGSASVPGSVMVGKPQRPTHQDGHFQTKKQGAQLTSEGELIRIPLEIFLRNFGGWKFPLEFSGTHSNFRLHRLSSHRLLLWCFFPRWGPDSETRGYWWRGGVFQIVASKMMTCRCVCYMPPKNMEAGELSTDDDATMLRAGEIFWVELLAYGNVGRGQYWSLLWMFVSPCEPQVSWMEFSPH